MTANQFGILTCTVLLVGLLFFTEIVISQLVHNDERKLALLARIAEEGNGYTARWKQLAARTYQLSQQDPALKEVLARRQINIKVAPQTAGNPPPGTVALRPLASPTTTSQPPSSAPGSTAK